MKVVDHDNVKRPENLWALGTLPYLADYYKWWREYYQKAHALGVGPRLHARFFQKILGPQTTTVVFVHRNWVWDQPDEKWTLYVDRRGPAFHVNKYLSAAECWEAFLRFRVKVDKYLANPT